MLLSSGQLAAIPPQALAETTPLVNTGYWYASDGLWLERLHATYAQIYKSQAWVATVVDKLANATARLSLRVWDTTPDTGKVLDTTSPYARLIGNPCPTMPPYAFWRWIAATYEIYGETFLIKVRDDTGRVGALLPMHPTRTAVRRDDDGQEFFQFQVGVASAGLLTAPATDVVPFRAFHPDGQMRGLSRLESLRSTLLNEDAARRATASWWRRGGRPGVILSTDKRLDDTGKERLRRSWDAAHGGADKMGGTAVLEDGVTPTVVQLSAEDMQYIESRKLNREEVCARMDVPPPVVHILDHATFSNITEQMRSMYRDTMAPRLEDLESVVDFHLRPEFGAGQYASFALDEVLRGDFETRATAVQKLVSTGVMKPSEARPLFDLPDAGPVADELFANAALVPLGNPQERITVTTPAPEPLDDVGVDDDPPVFPAASTLPAGRTARAARSAPASSASSAGSTSARTTSTRTTSTRTTGTGAGTASTGAGRAGLDTAAVRRTAAYRALMGRVGRAKAADRAALRAALVAEHRKTLGRYFRAQGAAAERNADAGDGYDALDGPDADDELAAELHTLGRGTADSVGEQVARRLGGAFDSAAIADWLVTNARDSASRINAQTRADVDAKTSAAERDEGDPVDAVRDYFAGLDGRADEIADSRVTVVGGLAEQSAARQSGATSKTWVVNSPNARPSHDAVNGETVPLGELFSNGMNGPGDPSGGADEVAGCTCSLDFSTNSGDNADAGSD